MHNAFDAVQIIKDSTVKIESIGLWGPRLLVGCMDGSLRIYAPDSLLDDGGDYGYSRQQGEEEEKEEEQQQQQLTLKPSSSRQSLYVLRDTRIGFSKKAVVAMDVLQSRSLLISLSDAVFVHTLPDFDVVAHLTKSKGASMYAWDEERGMLCVAKAKRLFLYRYDGKPYTHPPAVFLPLLLLLELSISLSLSIASLIWRWSNASASIHRLQLASSSIKDLQNDLLLFQCNGQFHCHWHWGRSIPFSKEGWAPADQLHKSRNLTAAVVAGVKCFLLGLLGKILPAVAAAGC